MNNDIERLERDLHQYVVSLNDFDIGKQIGHGGFSEVYYGVQKATGIHCALKMLNIKNLNGEKFVIYEREIRILADSSSQFILGFVGFTVSYPFTIITEYASKGSLYDALHHMPNAPILNGTQKTIIAIGISVGMWRLHKIRVIHRDLKSLNILLDDNCLPKICDFGLSRYVKSPETILTIDIGTPHWMAPELFESRDYTNKVDVYAFGMLLWEILVGAYPFKGRTAVQIAYSVCKKGERPKIPKRTPEGLENLIQQCWAQKPEDRPTFHQIYKFFQSGLIRFPGTDESQIESTIRSIENERKAQKVASEMGVSYLRPALTTGSKGSIPQEFRSNQPPKFLVNDESAHEINFEILSDCFSSRFKEDFDEIRKKLQPEYAHKFFSVILPHFHPAVPVDILDFIISRTADLLWENNAYYKVFIEKQVFIRLPLDNTYLADSLFEILIKVFWQSPEIIDSRVIDSLNLYVSIKPQSVLRLIHIYTCIHLQLPLFWKAADILITQASVFLSSPASLSFIRLIFTLIQLHEGFKTARADYIYHILVSSIQSGDQNVVNYAYNILCSVIDNSNHIDQTVFVIHLRDPLLCDFAVSALSRLSNISPTLDLIMSLLSVSQRSDIANLLLCRCCETEAASLKISEIVDDWSSLPLPTYPSTMRLVLVILQFPQTRKSFMKSEAFMELLKMLCQTRKPEWINPIGSVLAIFKITPDFVDFLSQTDVLAVFVNTSIELNDPKTMASCFMATEIIARVSWSNEFLSLLPLLQLLIQQNGWEVHSVSLLATLSCYQQSHSEILSYGFDKMVSALKDREDISQYASVFLSNIGLVPN